MRTLMKVSVPVESGNASIQEGRLPIVLEQTLGRLNPEAAYFFTEHGQRGALIVFDLKDPSEIPMIAEPLFQGFNAAVEFIPVMNREELVRGLGALQASAASLGASRPAGIAM